MKQSWFKGLETDDQEEEIRREFATSSLFREKLTQLLEAKEKEVYHSSLSSKKYTDANWAYGQADTIGFIRALRYVKSLIEQES